MSARKPHNGNAGYVCELRCQLGGHIVIYDRDNGFEIDADYRWIVMHEPSSLHVAVGSLSLARHTMKGVARATTLNEAMRYADILPRPGSNSCEANDDGAEETLRRERKLNAADERAALERFLADPDNEPSAEGKAALRRAFGL